MAFAVTLRLDPVSAASIEEVRRAVATDSNDTDPLHVCYAPHVTLAIYPDDTALDSLRDAVEQLAGQWRALPVTLSALGIFPGPTPVIWAAPVVTSALLVRRAAIHVARPELPAHQHYRADTWVPHVTLAGAVQDAGPVLSALLRIWQPVTGVLDRVELVHFPPVEVLESHALEQGG
jgi:2'-5' RNA ligase